MSLQNIGVSNQDLNQAASSPSMLNCEEGSLELMASNAVDEENYSQSQLHLQSSQFNNLIFQSDINFSNSSLNELPNIEQLQPLPNLSELFVSLENTMQEFYQQRTRSNSIIRLYLNYFIQDAKIESPAVKPQLKTKKLRCAGKQCSICFSRINKNSRIPRLKCKHNFHKKCLQQWVDKKSNCPLCRHAIE